MARLKIYLNPAHLLAIHDAEVILSGMTNESGLPDKHIAKTAEKLKEILKINKYAKGR